MKTIILKKEKIYKGFLVLVNPWHALRCDYRTELISADEAFPDIYLQRDAVDALQTALREIQAGDAIVPVSGYRSLEEQTAIYSGCLLDDGEEFTKKYVAMPGHSEHQVGLAIDLGLRKENIDFIRPDFPYDGICQEFRGKAPDFGFIERYPAGKESVTGTGHEPWHFRYVGFPHSRIMTDRGLTLEEYMEFIRTYQEKNPLCCSKKPGVAYGGGEEGEISIFYVPAAAAAGSEVSFTVPDDASYQISGNNMDGFIITLWRHTNGDR